MRILLPPSERKIEPPASPPLNLSELLLPELTGVREQLLTALASASRRPDAAETLKVPAGRSEELVANTRLRVAHTAPAGALFSGVLYDAFDQATLTADARRRARKRVLIFSALFGVLRPTDRIPPYRLAVGTQLPSVGGLAAVWRRALTPALADRADDLLIDCRSSSYIAMWRPPGAVPVRVFREEAGQRTVVTHMAKQARGMVARALVQVPRAPRTAAQAADYLSEWLAHHPVTTAAGVPQPTHVELGEAGSLDVITRQP